MAKIPAELIDKVALCGPKAAREGAARGLPRRGRRHAAREPRWPPRTEERLRMLRDLAEIAA